MLKTKQVHCSYGDALASLSIMIVIHLSYLLPSNYVSVKMPLWTRSHSEKKKGGETDNAQVTTGMHNSSEQFLLFPRAALQKHRLYEQQCA